MTRSLAIVAVIALAVTLWGWVFAQFGADVNEGVSNIGLAEQLRLLNRTNLLDIAKVLLTGF
jgi:hypothetical protein